MLRWQICESKVSSQVHWISLIGHLKKGLSRTSRKHRASGKKECLVPTLKISYVHRKNKRVEWQTKISVA